MKKLICLMMLLMAPCAALAGEPVWEIRSETGAKIATIALEPEAGDEYISGDNQRYLIREVRPGTAIAEPAGSVELPDVSWLEMEEIRPVSALRKGRAALYCTHSDESYEPSDGLYSDETRGSIYEVAQALAQALQEEGVDAQLSRATHYPHDAGAYRRSRQTAAALLKEEKPSLLLDVHRDGVPDPAEYTTEIGGKECSKIRLLVGRGNQNMEVNREFALMIKAVADQVYPGLIKDIYMGKGAFNQDLLPRSILLECGTYTLEKELVLRSMPLLADVLDRTLYGGITGSAGAADAGSSESAERGGVTQGQPDPAAEGATQTGAGKGMLWLIGIAAAGLIGYGILSAGSVRGGFKKAGRQIGEMTGGLLGKKPEKSERKND